MNNNLKLILAMFVGLLGGAALTHFLSPASVLAQNRMLITTKLGVNLGEFNETDHVIKLIPGDLKLTWRKPTDHTVTIEISDGKD